MNQGSGVSCQFENNQPNEYRLTSVEGNSTSRRGGGFGGGDGGFGDIGGGGFGGGGGGGGGFNTNKGFDNWEQDGGSCMSDGQRSAVIDIGRGGGGGGNNFYPSLPQYDD